jgi:hypothetical protein
LVKTVTPFDAIATVAEVFVRTARSTGGAGRAGGRGCRGDGDGAAMVG